MRCRALVESDGTAYFGFQRQPHEPTIQGQLETALGAVAGEPVMVVGAGRTDSGVHATGQVIAFNVRWRHGNEALQRALNANLPEDIAIRDLREAAEDFHPRFSARRRTYVYRIHNVEIRSPLHRRTAWHVPRPLAMIEMDLAAKAIVGLHDLATFGQAPQGHNTKREVFKAIWRKQGELLLFEIEANAFLFRMVRSLVGCMKTVGEGRWTVTDFSAALKEKDRSQAAQTAPPHGLCLTSVTY
ncbi:MAG: tRNA pseudouridine(38-40) synthase TruA [Chloroflexota bacterium]|nr:MAG: tRNA pseudouridine(38-40) synthase TruA [Chloroflexota bacterium]